MFEKRKVVVRHLPPDIPESVFFSTLNQWNEVIVWKSFVQGKKQKKGIQFSTAYLYFKNHESLVHFYTLYNNWKFRNKFNEDFYVIVEYAPNQRIPFMKPEENSVKESNEFISQFQEDPLYSEFLCFKEKNDKETSLEETFLQDSVNKITPLLEHIKTLKLEGKLKKEKNFKKILNRPKKTTKNLSGDLAAEEQQQQSTENNNRPEKAKKKRNRNKKKSEVKGDKKD
jgi:regulator of nonsense transcripts 3